MSENQKTIKTIVLTNLPIKDGVKYCEWNWDLQAVFDVCEYPIQLHYDSAIDKLINSNNVFFKCSAPNGKQIIAACNALFRALLNLSCALGEYDDDK